MPRTALAGGGIVLRNPKLRLVAAMSVRLGPIQSPVEAELAALVLGLEAALEFDARDMRVWNDNLALVHYLNGEGKIGPFEVPGLLSRMADLRRQFRRIEFRWTRSSHAPERRAGEPTADSLARQAVGLGDRPLRRRGQ